MLPELPDEKAMVQRGGGRRLARTLRHNQAWLVARDATGGSAGSAAAGLAVSLASHSTTAGVITGGAIWVLAGAGVALRAWWRRRRSTPGSDLDPWALPEPWRQLVQDALASERRFGAAASSVPPGPLHDRVAEMVPAVHAEVLRVWSGARQGAALSGGYPAGAGVPPAAAIAVQLREIQEKRAADRASGLYEASQLDSAEEAVAERLRQARRAEAAAARILDGLRAALASLEGAVTSLVELDAGGARQPGLEPAVPTIDSVAEELSALRSGLDEVAGILPTAGDPSQEPPPGR